MSTGYVHSVKVPRLYKVAAGIVKNVCENGASLKSLIYQKNHPNVSGIYALTTSILQRGDLLDQLLHKTGILFKEPRLDPWLARVLLTELLWGKRYLSSSSKPVQTILSYESQLRIELRALDNPKNPSANGKTVMKPRYVRVNTIRLSVDKAISRFQDEGWFLLQTPLTYSEYLLALSELQGSNFIQDFHIPELLAFPAKVSFHNHIGYLQGELILQDKASCLSAYLLNPEPGSVVLDMCAAPGMKTSHLAAIMRNQGKIVAVEIDEDRCKILHEQITLTDSTCVTILNKDASALKNDKYLDVEYVLVDPSCSGSGIIDRPRIMDTKEESNPARLKSLQSFQVFLLRHALLNFPNVKRVVYSTCSVHPEENEHVVDEILCKVGKSYNLLSAKDLLGGHWINTASTSALCRDNCLRAVSNVDLSNGFFIAVFERNFDTPLPNFKYRDDSAMSNVTAEKRKRKRRGKKRKIFCDGGENLTICVNEMAERKRSMKEWEAPG